ncbi:bifunctional sterol desaturase/short chain dehydrogenase [Baaleninema simplex]|uniref:bifunctional sterol desaturase/short chain dehydrogenase n=1 Tax=Baaleninema simplex TaxID=2862350 RepID=UPI000347DFF4|nr:bifunctional sterol desaturase/short chain dehydrogenase [Baaleninema simplex]
MTATDWVAIAVWGMSSIVWVEIVRDCNHALAHVWQPLGRLHNWHHRVFRPDLTPVSETIYRQAQWRNDLPESLVMLTASGLFGVLAFVVSPNVFWAALAGTLYSLSFLFGAIARGMGWQWAHELTDLTHLPGPFQSPPSQLFVNRPYHWRHHFDNQDAYFSGALTLVDRALGTALSLKGKTVAVTGASGTLGTGLLKHLHLAGAKVVALTSSDRPLTLDLNDETLSIKTVKWQVGRETELAELFEKIDILILNHGINVGGERTPEAIERSFEINTFSSWRLMEQFLTTVRTNRDMVCKEVWVNTSEAEVSPAFSPLYELSKRTLGDLVTMRRLDAPCIVRKLILGPFKSNLNPIGIMSGDRVAKQIVKQAKRDTRNIIVTINPITGIAFPIKEFFVSWYFRLFSHERKTPESQES